jgi:nucleoside-diphosphate-sugar epimerase
MNEAPTVHLQAYAGVTAMVLGAGGFIGRWVARALTAAGARPVLVVRHRSGAEMLCARYGISGELVEADLTDLAALERLLAAAAPAVVFNLAGYGVRRSETDEGLAFRLNADLVDALAAALAQRDRRWHGRALVHAGSMLEYGPIGGDLSEDATPRPTTPYGRAKLAGTQRLSALCRATGLDAVTARLFSVYGPGEPAGRLLPALIDAARHAESVSLSEGRQRRDFTFVEDVADGLLRLGLAAAPPGAVVNLATGRLTTVRAFVETAADIMHLPAAQLRFGAIPVPTPEIEHQPVTLSRLRQLTAWTPPTGIAHGIRRTLEFETASR